MWKWNVKKIRMQQLDEKHLQKHLDENNAKIKANQLRKKEAASENRCLTHKNWKLGGGINSCKTAAQKTQKDLKAVVQQQERKEQFQENMKHCQEIKALTGGLQDDMKYRQEIKGQLCSYMKVKQFHTSIIIYIYNYSIKDCQEA